MARRFYISSRSMAYRRPAHAASGIGLLSPGDSRVNASRCERWLMTTLPLAAAELSAHAGQNRHQ